METLRLSREIAQVDADDDACLVAAAQRRRAEFAALYDKYFLRVYRYVARRIGSQQDAEDITAQVFTEALDRLGSYREQGSFAAWLFTIAHHRVTDHYRRRGQEVSLESANAQGLESPDPMLEHWAILDERLRLLAHTLHTLTAEQQEVLALRYFAELRYGDIARTLGKSQAAVKMMAYRALDELRERMLAGEER